VPIVIGAVAKWPPVSRARARQWLLGNGEPPPEVIALSIPDPLAVELPDAAHVLNGATNHEVMRVSAVDVMDAIGIAAPEKKKRGRPKKQKPCSGCGTLCDEALCATCKARLGGPGMPVMPAPPTTDPWAIAAARADAALREEHASDAEREG